MKVLFDLEDNFPGTFRESVRLMLRDRFDECAIAVLLMSVHVALVAWCSSQPDAAHGIWFGMVLAVATVYLKVMLSDCRMWASHAFYFAWFLFASYHARFGVFA